MSGRARDTRDRCSGKGMTPAPGINIGEARGGGLIIIIMMECNSIPFEVHQICLSGGGKIYIFPD